MIRPDSKGRRLEHGFKIFEQQLVLKNAARKHDRVALVFLAQRSRRIEDAESHAFLKGTRAFAVIATMKRSFAKLSSKGRKSSSPSAKGNGYASVQVAPRAFCSSHIAAWPSKVVSRVNPSSAAAASKRRPIEVVVKVRTPLRINSIAF